MDPYKLLELEPGASEEDIKKAWKRLARVHHPDLNQDDPDAQKRFVRIKDAYDLLMSGDLGAAVRARSMDGDWVDSVTWMAKVRQREVMQNLLPRFVGAYGTGAALAWALGQASDLDAAASELPPRRQQWSLKRLKLDVVIDERRAWWGLASLEKRPSGGLSLVIFATELWRRRPDDEDELRKVVYAAVDHGLAAALPAALGLRRVPVSLEQARELDRLRSRDRWFWRLIWAGVAALSAIMIGWSVFQGSGGFSRL